MDSSEQYLGDLFSGKDRERAIVGAELLSKMLEEVLSAFMTGRRNLVEDLLNAESAQTPRWSSIRTAGGPVRMIAQRPHDPDCFYVAVLGIIAGGQRGGYCD
jgi:hypothetical protein